MLALIVRLASRKKYQKGDFVYPAGGSVGKREDPAEIGILGQSLRVHKAWDSQFLCILHILDICKYNFCSSPVMKTKSRRNKDKALFNNLISKS